MPRPSLTAALARLAELRRERDRLAIKRRRVELGEAADRTRQFAEIDEARLKVEAEIRGLVVHIRIRAASKPSQRSAARAN